MKEETFLRPIETDIDKLITRSLPHNILAEQMLLGTILVDNEMMSKVNDFLSEDHFFDPIHKKIYETIKTFSEKGIIANPVTLKNYFDKEEGLKNRGGAQYLVDLASLSATIINVHDYGRAIYDLALRRQLIHIGEEITNDAFDKEQGLSANEQIDMAEQKLYNIADDYLESNKGFVKLNKPLSEAISKAQQAFRNKGSVSGIATDFADLDELLGGFQDSDLIIVAGRPSMGKTALSLNFALNCCQVLLNNFENKKDKDPHEKPKSIGFFSLEMSAEQLASRLISTISGINTSKLRTGHVDEEEFGKIVNASKELQSLQIFIDDTPSLTISALRTRARRLKRKHNLGILFIDYLQLLRSNANNKDQNRVQEISDITQGLKAIAKELHIPVVAGSQLSRAVEQREDKRPLLSDLRESGTIEQDSDIVIFIYREEYYLLRRKPTKEGTDLYEKWQQDMDSVKNITDLIVAKHRNGPVGNVKLYFDSNLTKFANYQKNF